MKIEPIKLSEPVRNIGLPVRAPAVQENEKSFSDILSDSLKEVNRMQIDAQKASIDLAAGKIQDISQVAIASEKASIALQLTMQVRNKIVDAYQEIMRMQV